MNFRILKKIRVAVSLIILLLITFVFIDFSNTFSGDIIQAILFLEFIPSLLNFIKIAGFAAIGFIFIILLSLLFGRIYCSTICPLGTLQDIVIWIRKKTSRRFRFAKQRSFNQLRYSILIISIAFLLFGWIHPLLLLDPYSNYGRIVANLVRPVYLLLNNLGAHGLESMEIYYLYRVEPGITHLSSILFSAGFFLLICWMSFKYARLFCNTLCPVGAFLGFLSRYSLYRIRLKQSICTSCGKCAAVCKAGCIDKDKKTVDFSRCVGCLNCLTSCPSGGVVFSKSRKEPETVPLKPFDPGRREILSGALVLAASAASFPLLAQRHQKGKRCKSPQEINRKYPITPPGAVSIDDFNAACTACHLCVSACPTHVIKPAFLEYGLSGFMQPRMDYYANFCNFDCVVCTEVCPTGALRPLSLDEKHVLQLGKVRFVKHNCIVFTEGTDCGACSEHCPTKAVNMRPYKQKLFLPVVNPDICVGCGACEYACPTEPKSIYVEGNPVHLIADKPLIEELEQPDKEEDFPF